MTVTFAIKTIIELALIILLAYGFYYEERVARFERKVGRFIRFMFNSYRQDFMRKRLTVHSGQKKSESKNADVSVA